MAPGRQILLDGAHNPAGAEALAAELHKATNNPTLNSQPSTLNSPPRPTLIFGVFSDKDWHAMGALLAPQAGRILLVPVKSQRGLSPEALAPVCHEASPETTVSVCASLADALNQTANDPRVVITGSLYLIGEAMELLALSAAPTGDERGLNEWNAAAR